MKIVFLRTSFKNMCHIYKLNESMLDIDMFPHFYFIFMLRVLYIIMSSFSFLFSPTMLHFALTSDEESNLPISTLIYNNYLCSSNVALLPIIIYSLIMQTFLFSCMFSSQHSASLFSCSVQFKILFPTLLPIFAISPS